MKLNFQFRYVSKDFTYKGKLQVIKLNNKYFHFDSNLTQITLAAWHGHIKESKLLLSACGIAIIPTHSVIIDSSLHMKHQESSSIRPIKQIQNPASPFGSEDAGLRFRRETTHFFGPISAGSILFFWIFFFPCPNTSELINIRREKIAHYTIPHLRKHICFIN